MKFFQEHCTICKKVQAMPVVQEDDSHPGLIWVRCPTCQEVKPIETEPRPKGRSRSKEIAPAQGTPEGRDPADMTKRAVRHYRAGEKFETGEWIYHPEWCDVGKIIEKARSNGGREIIVVDFEKMGMRRLVNRFAS